VSETLIRLEEGATLEYLPDHVIPHNDSALRQSLRLEMAPGSRAIVLDAMAAGRVAHGERWVFREIDSRVDVRIQEKLTFLNRTKIVPASLSPERIGFMEDFDYIVCMGIFAAGFSDWMPVVAAMNAELATLPAVHGGASVISRGGCVVRFLARSAPDMTRMNQKLWDAARELVIQLPPFDHRKY
jgi:urease accessory protein